MATTASTHTARKAYRCEGFLCVRAWIEPGEEYARLVAFPGDDANPDGPEPWTMRICVDCQTRYGRPMPPRRTRAVTTDGQ